MRGGNSIEARRPSVLLRRQDGAAAVEFALISIILFTVIFAIIQYGFWLSEYQVMQGAAREGARVAAVRGDTTAINNAITQAASPYTVTGPITVITENSQPNCTPNTIGQLVTVSWTQSMQGHLFALVPPLPDTKDIKGVFRCE